MQEYLSKYEKMVLEYVYRKWQEKYAITLEIKGYNLSLLLKVDLKSVDNIMRGLILRGYFRSCYSKSSMPICCQPIELTEKALNYFNRGDMDHKN